MSCPYEIRLRNLTPQFLHQRRQARLVPVGIVLVDQSLPGRAIEQPGGERIAGGRGIGGPPFGGAKPVPVNPRNYRNYRRGDIIVSLAGIATNLALFLLSAAAYAIVGLLAQALSGVRGSLAVLQSMMFIGMYVNLGL